MKKIILKGLLSILLILLVSVSFFSCATNGGGGSTPSLEPGVYCDEEYLEHVGGPEFGALFEFKSNGNYAYKNYIDEVIMGTWTVEGDSLIVTNFDNNNRNGTIIDSEKFTFYPFDSDRLKTFVKYK